MILEARFRFSEKSEPSEFTYSVASLMQNGYPPDWVLSASMLIRDVLPMLSTLVLYIIFQFDFNAVTDCLNCLHPEKFRFTLAAKEISDNLTLKEKWYGTEYSCENFSASLIKVR